MSLPSEKISMMNLFSNTKFNNKEIIDFWSSWKLTTRVKDKIEGEGLALISEGDTWHSIAETVYGEREFWWVLALFNEVEDPFALFFDSTVPSSITKIKIIKPEYIDIIIEDVRRKRIEKEKERFN